MIPVGTVLKLREPLGGAFDYVKVTGRFDTSENTYEIVLTGLCGFAPPVSVAEDSLFRTGYEPVSTTEAEQQPWATPAEEIKA